MQRWMYRLIARRLADARGLASLLLWVRRAERARVRHAYERQFARLKAACERRDRRLRNARVTIANYDAEIARLTALLKRQDRQAC